MVKITYHICFIIVLILLATPAVLALNIEITVKTEPFHSLFIQIANPSDEIVIDSRSNKTDVPGTAQFDFSTTLDELTFFVITRHPLSGEVVYETWFYDVPVEKNIYLNVLEKEGVEEYQLSNESEITNETAEDETEEDNETITELENQTQEENESITGLAISEEGKKVFLNKTYYIIGVIILLVIVIFIVTRKVIMNKAPPHLTKKGYGDNAAAIYRDLVRTERKLKNAQAEINRFKNKGKIQKAERKLEEDRKELERLRKGEDNKEEKKDSEDEQELKRLRKGEDNKEEKKDSEDEQELKRLKETET